MKIFLWNLATFNWQRKILNVLLMIDFTQAKRLIFFPNWPELKIISSRGAVLYIFSILKLKWTFRTNCYITYILLTVICLQMHNSRPEKKWMGWLFLFFKYLANPIEEYILLGSWSVFTSYVSYYEVPNKRAYNLSHSLL